MHCLILWAMLRCLVQHLSGHSLQGNPVQALVPSPQLTSGGIPRFQRSLQCVSDTALSDWLSLAI